MSTTWVIISWVFVAVLTILNVLFFLKLKKASEQMMKMAFPGAKNMNQAMQQMQGMMAGMNRGGAGPGGRGGNPFGPAGGKINDAQLKAAMDMLKNMQQGKK